MLCSVPRENLNLTFVGVMSLSVAEICTTSWSVKDEGQSVSGGVGVAWGSLMGILGLDLIMAASPMQH